MICDGRAEGPYNDLRTANSIRSILIVVTGGRDTTKGGREKWETEISRIFFSRFEVQRHNDRYIMRKDETRVPKSCTTNRICLSDRICLHVVMLKTGSLFGSTYLRDQMISYRLKKREFSFYRFFNFFFFNF